MSGVKLILTESVHNLGEAGDVVRVRPGYARNYLLPQGKAIPATESRVAQLEHHRRIVAARAAKQLEDLRARKTALEAQPFEVSARAGEAGRLFGSVTSAHIAELLAERGFEVDRRRIELREPIKEVGDHSVPVKLHREVVARIALRVVAVDAPEAEDEEAPAFSDEDERRAPRERRETSEESDED